MASCFIRETKGFDKVTRPREGLKRLHLWQRRGDPETPAAGVSQIKLAKADKTDIAIAKTQIDDKAKSMFVELDKPLAVGAYVITWRGAGDDGHVLSGEIKFSIAAPKTR